MKKLIGLFVFLLLVGTQIVTAQSKQITGTVTSADDGLGLPGVAVVIKGTTIGTSTDIDGKYSIEAGSKDILMYSFVGMSTVEIKIGNQSQIDVKLSADNFGLDEIIVSGVASGTSKKKLSVSVTKVGSDRLEDVPATSAAGALQGKVAGVSITYANGEPGAAANIQLRGATQLVGSQEPLIIVDGVMMEGSFGDINVDDIKNMEVVKGASASALYGSRAGNGVIVVTTKRGKSLGEGKTEVRIRNEFGKNVLADTYDLSTHHAYTLADDFADFSDFTKYAGVSYPSGYAGGQNTGLSGTRSLDDDHYMDNPYASVNNQQEEMFEGKSFYTNYISVANNSGKTNFMASFENNHQGGVVFETDGYDRQSFRLNVDHQLTDKLSLSASNSYIRTESDQPGGASTYNGGVFFALLLTQPDVNLYLPNADGQPYQFIPDPWEKTTENPLYNLAKQENLSKTNRFLGSYAANWSVTDWLRIEGKYAFESRDRLYTEYVPYDTYERGSDVAGQISEGSMYRSDTKQLAQTAQGTMHLNKDFGDLKVRAKISYLYENNLYENFNVYGKDFGVSGIPNLNGIKGAIDISSYESEVVAENYFGILSLDYKDRYIFDGMFRMDGSSLFGEDARWNSYYRISGAYRITKDVNIPNVQELKLRAAYGTAGQRPNFSAQYEIMSLSKGVSTKSQAGNRNLKPSHSSEIELGLDALLFNRFNLEFVYSKTDTDDQFMDAPLASHLAGFNSQWMNAASLESKTIEIALGANIIKKKDFQWDVNVTFDRTRSKINELDIPAYQTGPEGQDAASLFYVREGETFGVMYGADWVTSLDQMSNQLAAGESISDYVVNSDGYVIAAGTEGSVDEAPIKVLDEDGKEKFGKIGNITPDFKMGFSTNLKYKGFSAYVLLDWKQGGDVYNKTAQWLTRDNRHAMMDQFGKAQDKKKTIEYYKTFYDTNNMNSFWVEDASYVKVREISLYYTLKENDLTSFANGFIKEIKFGVIGRNLFTFTDYSGYDPEVATSGADGQQIYSYDFMGYPNYRTFSASIELKF